jgi:bifunctional DNA-binding transcriptional regulator/antitoxin component of YhaV-PrlF toxin-antitoxin module
MLEDNMKKWTAYVEQDGDDLILPFPAGLIEEMGWKIGDVLAWDVREDGTVTLTKKPTWYQILWKRITSWR